MHIEHCFSSEMGAAAALRARVRTASPPTRQRIPQIWKLLAI
jgi:hypothetical protein